MVNIATPMFETVVGDCSGLVMSVKTRKTATISWRTSKDFVAAVDEAVAAPRLPDPRRRVTKASARTVC